ncbi:hypothetical protein [Phnomibacter ginsenosidimutans]|uniref:Uncharacterized protein n=1 Tax=Phnomibacter ginsenosidimutans TaxID=2676868 RepID=A0A6I6H1Q1_9BACT|nr:hypothetical protein [Phnomibacter ginsenosidimutans]QGW28551.1 hypothetical protein GLV81_10960 [Phnomibacter ginsenosidimutans]
MYGVGLYQGLYLADFLYSENYDLKRLIYESYIEFSGDELQSKKVANQLYRHIGIFEIPKNFSDEINRDLLDPSFTENVIKKSFKHFYPHSPFQEKDFFFNVSIQSNGMLLIESSIDLNKYPLLASDSIILNIGTAIEEIKIAANYASEISTPELNSTIISAKFNSLITKINNSAKNIELFQYSEFPTASLSETINKKHKSMREFLDILRKSEKFKDWLTDLGDDNKLIKEYNRKVYEKSWIQSLPSKAGRFYLLQGISTILKASGSLTGIAAGVAMSAANTFFVERLFNGWRPNHFIEEEIIPFINKQ